MNWVYVCVILACLGLSLADNERTPQEVIECFRHALNGGIPSIGLPNYNPYEFSLKQIHVSHQFVNGTLNFTDFVVEGLLKFEVKELSGGPRPDGTGVSYNYSLFWPSIKVEGEYAHNLSILDLGHFQEAAHINITLEEAQLNGVWDMTTGENQKLDFFYGEPYVEYVDDNSENEPTQSFIERFMRTMTIGSFNNFAKLHRNELGDWLSPLVQDTLNQGWIVGGKDRIKTVFEHCSE